MCLGTWRKEQVSRRLRIMVSGPPYKWADYEKQKKLMTKGGRCDI